ncbi:hypothetical protein DMC61_16070 [Amycolatopsis sp. WAC 04169]|uniref:hypothetical protein n=1 Tax=Amycolatopsis sp. WAC 04169 TaxID=2203197 RepID=UPI000F7A5856|nr:hypothetical protein [Amycolatopsis sp. WAC 04169]RSN31645.1 hypothetical protein DMC61_16070 [Amycolatopsis sp. WAC 04169]
MTSPALSPLAGALARTDFAESWYRWCDARRDWAAEATGTYDEDSLLTASGGFAALPASEFMRAYRVAGAEVSRGSTGRRSFTVEVAAGDVVCVLTVQLGRGLNSQECRLAVFADGERQGEPEMLHTLALAIRRSRGEPDPEPPYPRPIIGSRSQLEVVSREIVDVLGQVARGWTS